MFLQDYMFYATDVEMKYTYKLLHLDALVQEAARRHDLKGRRAEFLAEVLLAGNLLASQLIDDERINLRIHCGSDFTAAAEVTKNLETRGYFEGNDASPVVMDLDEGMPFRLPLQVRSIRQQSKSEKLFEGVTQSTADDFEEAFNHHLENSYQQKCRIRLSVWHDATGSLRAYGVLFAELPNLSAQDSVGLWSHVDSLPPLRELVEASDDPDLLAQKLIPDPTHPVASLKPVWRCTCSQEAVENVIRRLPTEDKTDIIQKNEPVEIRCHYCNTKYNVSVAKVSEFLATMGKGTSTLH